MGTTGDRIFTDAVLVAGGGGTCVTCGATDCVSVRTTTS